MSLKNTDRLATDDKDELEYNIAFPINEGRESGDAKDPVIYLFGWAGATDKHLAKYSAIYENEGFITVRYINPIETTFSTAPNEAFNSTSNKLLQLLEDYDFQARPVFFHIFSNGGSMLYRYATEVFQILKTSKMSMYPHLFLYSTNDALIPWQHIEEIADTRREMGAAVKTVNFFNSPHVQHMRYHKEYYIDLTLKFLDSCLKIYYGTPESSDDIDISSSVDPPELQQDFTYKE